MKKKNYITKNVKILLEKIEDEKKDKKKSKTDGTNNSLTTDNSNSNHRVFRQRDDG